jgi:MFS family permease
VIAAGDERRQRRFVLSLLLAINTLNFFDRTILSAVTEPIRKEWGLSDTQLGWLGTAFTLLYAFVGVPLGRLTDVWYRKRLLVAGLAMWSALTYASGLCRNFGSMFAARLGVGIGEAACAPAATSMIGDLFRPFERARALAVFMVGLPLGITLSYATSGTVAQHFGWRAAFFVAGVPGLLLALVCLWIQEPVRGSSEAASIGAARREGSPYLLVLGIPTMWWIIASGALHNFNMYAINSFLPSFLIRFHGVSLQRAGFIAAVAAGSVGAVGMLAGGWAADRMMKGGVNGRLRLATLALAASVPASALALLQPAGALAGFMLFQSIATMTMYVYYATVYSTIQDIVEPSLRGTAMALYFFAMYVLGASFGPVATGWLSDHMARSAATAAGFSLAGGAIPEQFKAEGLHQAMYMIPVLGVLLAGVLFAASLTVTRDVEKLQAWMKSVAISHQLSADSSKLIAES